MQQGKARVGRRGMVYTLLALCVVWVCAPAQAAPVELDIPAQDLAAALAQFSHATGMAVLVDRELTQGRRSLQVKGRYSAGEGLERLLTGSGLMARYARADAFTLQTAQVRDEAPRVTGKGAGAVAPGSSYATVIQRSIERALCRTPLTRPGSFRAALQVWVGRDGRVQHSRLLASTGDGERDGALLESLRNLRIDRAAPSSLRQPVTLLLLPDQTGARMECKEQEGTWGP